MNCFMGYNPIVAKQVKITEGVRELDSSIPYPINPQDGDCLILYETDEDAVRGATQDKYMWFDDFEGQGLWMDLRRFSVPSGTIDITENGEYFVTEYAKALVDVESKVQEHEYNFWGTVANPIQEREDNTSIASAEVHDIWESIYDTVGHNTLATVTITIDATALGQGGIYQRLVWVGSDALPLYTSYIDSEFELGNFLQWSLSGDSVVLDQASMFSDGTITDLSPYASLCPTEIKVVSAEKIPALERTT